MTFNPFADKAYADAKERFARLFLEAKAQGAEFGNGIYEVEVTDCKWHSGFQGVLSFVVNLKVLASNVPEVPTGSEPNWIAKYTNKAAPQLIKDFLSKSTGIPTKVLNDDSSPNYPLDHPDPNLRGRLKEPDTIGVLQKGLTGEAKTLVGTKLQAIVSKRKDKEGKYYAMPDVSWKLLEKAPKLKALGF